MYRGINALNIDKIGRVALPTRYRIETKIANYQFLSCIT